jgi:ubiquinone/menaquinone biosynthesis C-methylase UbiE
MNCLRGLNFGSVAEIGCGAGANLGRINMEWPDVEIAGVDINDEALYEARKHFNRSLFAKGKAENIPLKDKSSDLVLTDACLIYVPLEDIKKAVNELIRVARKYIVMCEWNGPNQYDGHWVYDYAKLYEEYYVEFIKIAGWPGGWEKWGNIVKVDLENKRKHLPV